MTAAFALRLARDPYLQRPDAGKAPWLERLLQRLWLALPGRAAVVTLQRERFVNRVAAAGERLLSMGEAERSQELAEVRAGLRRHGLRGAFDARAFALMRQHAHEVLGQRHFDAQVRAAWVMLGGRLVEMDTGEGKTLTATLAAATAALAGLPVHVVTVNDYLASRDFGKLSPLYASLGLTTGLVTEETPPGERAAQYRRDIVYCSNKTVVFDYLRDRHKLGGRMKPLPMALDAMAGAQAAATLRGLHFAIVDEADSVFIDEARTPLILSATVRNPEQADYHREAVALARQLLVPRDAAPAESGRRMQLTEAGRAHLASATQSLGPQWRGELRRAETIEQALNALHIYRRDVHYIVRDGKVMIVDENTGRVMADRSWERGLHQMIEIKEGLPPSDERSTIARLSYQLFFRRYQHLSGMTGTCREVAGEVGAVYGLDTLRVPTRLPSRRTQLPGRVYATAAAKWDAVALAVQDALQRGQAVLVGTRSIIASEQLATRLTALGIAHDVLNAKQDREEARVVEAAGQPGVVTIATSMAGRGTDIVLHPAVLAAGGLHVILTERHDNARVDRQLVGRCARQGDPGSWQVLLSMEDELMRAQPPRAAALLRTSLEQSPQGVLASRAALALHRYAQWKTERTHAAMRRALLQADFETRRSLSFSGEME